jgi:hypothetical protein
MRVTHASNFAGSLRVDHWRQAVGLSPAPRPPPPGTETYSVTVRELQGDKRDRIYDEQARRYPGFADHA